MCIARAHAGTSSGTPCTPSGVSIKGRVEVLSSGTTFSVTMKRGTQPAGGRAKSEKRPPTSAEQRATNVPKATNSADDQPRSSDSQESILHRTALSLAGHALPPRKAAARTLAQFAQLRRLDLSDMKPSDDAPDGLINLHLLTLAESLSKKQAKKSDTPPLSKRLTWVNLSNNEALGTRDDALDGIDAFAALNGTCATDAVLNVSHCSLRALPVGLAALEQLKALVVSHNQITRLPTVFPHFPELNTLVLSNNQLTHLPKTLPASLPGLKKLSISHNLLEDGDSLPDFGVCAQLREVRLAGNKSLARLPEHIQRWGRGVDGGAPGLVLLDASDCGLNEWISIAPLLEQLDERRKGLVNLSLKGNAIAEREDYEEKVRP